MNLSKIFISWICILMLIASTSCSFIPDGGINTIANTTVVSYDETTGTGTVYPPKKAEKLLEAAFIKGARSVPWNAASIKRVENARSAIVAMGEFLKKKRDFNSSIPYYMYKSSFEYINNQYNILQYELDARVEVPGAISDEGDVIYFYMKSEIIERLRVQQLRIAQTEGTINDKASAASIAQLEEVFDVIKPLIDMAL